ncbi:winged helix-turn-helix domain-containing protein [Arthrobacter koreensis]|uniref:Winged helix-turn-helix domain-containing protein n=1 Tax=Arthrobacter koreensis TaxID=199136 RepID=A0ABY6FS53_9MICC|nr:winged helix-turn-helix domain-containing protein [Arthrobacter koreensis]UYB35940.1 winged helix-turn-helix domain-containing protein [Arthrobacter koreensis]
MDTTTQQVRQFLAECTVRDLDDSDVLPVADLYGMYSIWCERSGGTAVAASVFSRLVRADGIGSGIRRQESVFTGVAATGPIPIQYILETDKGPGRNSVLASDTRLIPAPSEAQTFPIDA